jgi:hypothetical protein
MTLYKYILFFIHKILSLYNKVCMMLFKIYFKPYFYTAYNGDIVGYKYITYIERFSNQNYIPLIERFSRDTSYYNFISDNKKQRHLIVTYECDKLYNCYNRIIYNPTNYLLTPIHVYTNYVFMNIILLIESYEFTIYLRTKSYNFYICDNIINSDFILFYLQNILCIFRKKYLFDPLYKDNLCYKLNILDHNFKQHQLTNNDTMILHKNTFDVIKNNKE